MIDPKVTAKIIADINKFRGYGANDQVILNMLKDTYKSVPEYNDIIAYVTKLLTPQSAGKRKRTKKTKKTKKTRKTKKNSKK